jgi:hypothetical protein
MSNDQDNKNKVLAVQLGKISIQFQKWQNELEAYTKWAKENDGAVSIEEKAEIDRRKKDIDAILNRVAQIVKEKGLLSFMGLLKVKTKAEAKESEILPTETALERPDPLKSVAALDNEEAMMMLEEDVNPETFEAFVSSWLGSIRTGLNECLTDENPRRETDIKLDFPGEKNIVKIAMSKLSEVLIGTDISTVGAISKKIQGKIDDLLKDKAWIYKEYRDNKGDTKEKYKKLSSIPLPTASDVVKQIKRPVAEVEKEAAEKEAYEAAKAKFDELIMSWYKDEVKDIINELEPLNVVSKTTLSSVVALSFLTEDSSSLGLLDGIKKRIFDALGDREMMVMDFKQTYVNQIDSFFKVDSADAIFEKYFKPLYPNDLRIFKLPTGFGKWLRNGSKVSNARGFLDIYKDWKGKIENVAAVFCLDIERMAKEDDYYKVDSLKVKDKVKKLFDKVIEGTNVKPGAILWDNLESKLSAAFYTAPIFKAFWEDAAALCNENSYFAFFTEVEKSGLSVAQMDAVIKTGLKMALPSSNDLLLALHDCDYTNLKAK